MSKRFAWYLADILILIRVQGDNRNVVHINTVLINAASPELAYEKALAVGRSYEVDDINPAGMAIKTTFCGLCDLNLIPSELTDGEEIIFEELVGVEDAEISKRIRTREDLGVFRKRPAKKDRPDYSSREVVEILRTRFGLSTDENTD